tara:strand:- start:34439 stop:35458 length:1020 start_codon:yes stop_codon:yes gene_type:complete
MPHYEDFMGKDGFVWWFGVVEDVQDPEMLGRCRVRIWGIHTDDKKEIPTEDLPWAHPMVPITSASISGVGTSPTGLATGSHVVGFFRDGHDSQQPIIMGSVGGIPQEKADAEKGFNDPKSNPHDHPYPKEDYFHKSGSKFINEPDTNRLARNEKIDETIVQIKKDRIEGYAKGSKTGKSIPQGNERGEWNEPEVPYAAEYPLNHVKETESGHVEEWDDTVGKERYHRFHRTGTSVEIHPNGDKVERNVKDVYVQTEGNENVHILGNCNLIVDGNLNVYVRGNVDWETDGDFLHTCHGNYTVNCDQTLRMTAGGSGIGYRSSSSTFNMSPGGRIDLNKES